MDRVLRFRHRPRRVTHVNKWTTPVAWFLFPDSRFRDRGRHPQAADDLARLSVEGGKQQQGAVVLVVVAVPLRLPAAHPGGALEAALQARTRTRPLGATKRASRSPP